MLHNSAACAEVWDCPGLLARLCAAREDARFALPLPLQDFANGKAQLVAPPVAGGVLRSTLDSMPKLLQMTESQKQHMREHAEGAMAAKRGQQPPSPGALLASSRGQPQLAQQDAAAPGSAGGEVKGEPGVRQDDGGAKHVAEAAEAAVREESGGRQEAAGSEQTSGQDMPELPEPDD